MAENLQSLYIKLYFQTLRGPKMSFLSVSRHEKDTPRILSARSSSTLPIFLAHFWPDQPLVLSLFLLLMAAVSGLYRLLIVDILSSLSEVEQREGEERRVRDRAEQHIYISMMIIYDMIYQNM